MGMMEAVIEIPAEDAGNVFGQFDAFAKKIERTLHVTLIARNEHVKIMGEAVKVEQAKQVLRQLLELSRRGNTIEEQNVDYTLSLVMEDKEESVLDIDRDIICHTIQGKPIKPKTLGQKKYVDAIRKKMIVFGLGPAGTGKTYLAMAMAITAFKNNEVGRIILTRPAIEAGEKLGFLPGDLQSKIDPYLRPLYDALYQIMGAESFLKNSEKGLIEVAPLAYMRGRTLDNAFIILDEAQNTTPAQMKMFLTRIGFGSKVVITGDETQKDLPSGQVSGLDTAVQVVKNIEDISICKLTSKDVVRHPLVQKIVKAYEEYEKKSFSCENKREEQKEKVMTLYYEEEGELKLSLPCEELARTVIEAALDDVGCPYEAEVNLLLTMNEQIHEMNLEFRGIDRATDVLSFPMVDYEQPGEFDFLKEADEYFHPETGELLLGDIVISKEKVIEQAEEFGHSIEREFAFLIAHSVLHLTGYDHIEEEERLVMEDRQRQILSKLNILR